MIFAFKKLNLIIDLQIDSKMTATLNNIEVKKKIKRNTWEHEELCYAFVFSRSEIFKSTQQLSLDKITLDIDMTSNTNYLIEIIFFFS